MPNGFKFFLAAAAHSAGRPASGPYQDKGGNRCPKCFAPIHGPIVPKLTIYQITFSDKMNAVIQPLKWAWTILFLCFVFVGGDFCDICPNKVFSPALGDWWVNLALSGFLTIPLLVGSFYINRFWCLMCPMGFPPGMFQRFNLFKLKKNCTACTECGSMVKDLGHYCKICIESYFI